MAMQQPVAPSTALPQKPFSRPPTPGVTGTATAAAPAKKKRHAPPSPEEVLAHYEAQGLSPREASLRAISDLEAMIFRYASKKDPLAADSPRRLEGVSARLAVLEMKLDSKPGFAESMAIGVASGSIVSAIPHVLGGLRGIWDSVRSATASSPPSS